MEQQNHILHFVKRAGLLKQCKQLRRSPTVLLYNLQSGLSSSRARVAYYNKHDHSLLAVQPQRVEFASSKWHKWSHLLRQQSSLDYAQVLHHSYAHTCQQEAPLLAFPAKKGELTSAGSEEGNEVFDTFPLLTSGMLQINLKRKGIDAWLLEAHFSRPSRMNSSLARLVKIGRRCAYLSDWGVP